MNHHLYKGKHPVGKDTLTVNLFLISFKDGESFIYYSPHLDLSGYGNTNEAARESFNLVLDEYCKYTLHKNTLWDDLKKHGWTVKSKQRVYPPQFSDLMSSNETLQDVINTRDFTKQHFDLNMPAYA